MGSLKKLVPAFALAAALCPLFARADVVISTDPTYNVNCAGSACTPIHPHGVININDLLNMLAAGNVTINTSFVVHGHAHNAGSIDINVPLSWANSSVLTLAGYYSRINAPVTIMGTGTLLGSVGSGFTYIFAPITVMGAGAVSFSGFSLAPGATVTFWDLNAKFTAYNIPFVLAGDVPTLAADIAAGGGQGHFALANDYDARNDIFLNAPIPDFLGFFTGLGHTIANLTIRKGTLYCEGLLSSNHGTFQDIRLQNARIFSRRQKYVGALSGCNYGNLFNVSVDGTVSGTGDSSVGGIAGENQSQIVGARATVSVSGGQAGGIVGENNGRELAFSYATGSVTGNSNAGGLVGANKSQIQECYSSASVNGNSGPAGGLAGFNSAGITDCYSTGTVAGTGYVGGFVGYDPNESVLNGYWDLDTSGINDPRQGAGFPQGDPSPTGLTTAQLQSRLPLGFDKTNWGLDASINNGFPYLLAAPPQ